LGGFFSALNPYIRTMTRIVAVSLLAFLAVSSAELTAQRSLRTYDLSAFAGTSNAIGNFANNPSINNLLSETRSQFGVGFTHFTGPRWGWGFEGRYGTLYADNRNHTAAGFTGIEMNSTYTQVQGQLTLHLRKFGKYYKRHFHTPYLRPGAGVVFTQSSYMYDVPYPANATIYNGTNPSLTYGMDLGWKFRLSEYQSLALEWGTHFVPGDKIEGFTVANDDTPDRINGLRVRYTYHIYTWE
jgi:hypothetical protein